jgi:hypothetical protein
MVLHVYGYNIQVCVQHARWNSAGTVDSPVKERQCSLQAGAETSYGKSKATHIGVRTFVLHRCGLLLLAERFQ